MTKQTKTNKKSGAVNSVGTGPGNIAKLAVFKQCVICQAVAFVDQQFIANHLFKGFSHPVVILVS